MAWWNPWEQPPFSKADCTSAVMSMKTRDGPLLFLLLSRDGAVNRMGDGAIEAPDRGLFMAGGKESLFQEFLDQVPETFLGKSFALESAEIRGVEVLLSVAFFGSDRRKPQRQYQVRYGSESAGPPEELCRLVQLGVDLTDPWWQTFRTGVKK